MNYPKFSVLLSLYNKEKPEYLDKSLQSIYNQTIIPSEVILIKDGFINSNLEIILQKYIDKFGLKVLGYEENMGLAYALNFGVKLCSYDIIARMDTDDISSKDRFEKELTHLINHKVDLIGSNTIEFEESITNMISQRIMPESHDEIVAYSKTRNPFIHPSIMTYKSVIIDSGNYQNHLWCEDYDLWVRIIEKGYKCYNIQENLVFMRVNRDFYKRRGGIKYCKSIISLKKSMYKKGYLSKIQYAKTKYATLFVSLMPGFLRAFIYKKFLRK